MTLYRTLLILAQVGQHERFTARMLGESASVTLINQ
jgi:hypothetical protein